MYELCSLCQQLLLESSDFVSEGMLRPKFKGQKLNYVCLETSHFLMHTFKHDHEDHLKFLKSISEKIYRH